MDLQKINVKFFAVEPNEVPLTAFIDVFHAWIQATDGIYYDVADYSHMNAGPGIVLVAHEANISIDEAGGRRGLLYNHKQPLQGLNQEKLRRVFREALEYCRKVEEEPALKGRIRFSASEALVLINDRLLASNTEESFRAVRSELDQLGRCLYGGADFSLARDDDSRRRFSVLLKTPAAFSVERLLKNIGTGTDA
jgi:hypothetical protein